MVMTNQEMMKLMEELQERLKRLGCKALFDQLPKLEHSPDAVRELLDLATRAEEGPAGSD